MRKVTMPQCVSTIAYTHPIQMDALGEYSLYDADWSARKC